MSCGAWALSKVQSGDSRENASAIRRWERRGELVLENAVRAGHVSTDGGQDDGRRFAVIECQRVVFAFSSRVYFDNRPPSFA